MTFSGQTAVTSASCRSIQTRKQPCFQDQEWCCFLRQAVFLHAPLHPLLLAPLISGTNLRSQLLCRPVGTHSCPQVPEFTPLQAGPEHACLARHHTGTPFSPHGFTRLVPTYSKHTHTCMYWAKSPRDPPLLGWLANGYNLILVEPFHCKPVQGLVGTVWRDRWSEEPTSTIPLSSHPCSPDLQSPPVALS